MSNGGLVHGGGYYNMRVHAHTDATSVTNDAQFFPSTDGSVADNANVAT